jgi:succinate-semialdehyde dehydrogenase/glutarate-semialdehyde dehydrogenase
LEQALEIAAHLQEKKSGLQEAAAMDAGFPVKITATEVDIAVRYLRTMEEEICWLEGGEPYGVVAAIFPYDAPSMMLARLAGAALITGNRLRFSFSSCIPLSAGLIAQICKPVPALEPVVGMDNRLFGDLCVNDPEVRVLFMSGAMEVGETYRSRCEAFDKLLFAGPGGMPAAVVFEDAEVEEAGRFIARRAFLNGGQYCATLKKALIHESLFSSVRDRVLDLTAQLRVGDPLDSDTDIGPIRVERTRRIIADAVQRCSGARLLCGGVDDKTVHPVILEAQCGWPVPDLQLFGPFLLLKPFNDPRTAVHELVQTRYGFQLYFFGSASNEIVRIFHQHFGMVFDNPNFLFAPLRTSFGGKKDSGWIIERGEKGWITRDGRFYYSKELVRQKGAALMAPV